MSTSDIAAGSRPPTRVSQEAWARIYLDATPQTMRMILIIRGWPPPLPRHEVGEPTQHLGYPTMARIGRPKPELTLSDTERTALAHRARSIRRDRAAALRARIILACSQGLSNRNVALRLGLAEHTVGKWRGRFVALRLAGLHNAPSPRKARAACPTPARTATAAPSPWWPTDGASLSALMGLLAPGCRAQAC